MHIGRSRKFYKSFTPSRRAPLGASTDWVSGQDRAFRPSALGQGSVAEGPGGRGDPPLPRESLERGGGGPPSPLPTALTLPERHSHTPTSAPTAFPTARNRPPPNRFHVPCDRSATALGLPRWPPLPFKQSPGGGAPDPPPLVVLWSLEMERPIDSAAAKGDPRGAGRAQGRHRVCLGQSP